MSERKDWRCVELAGYGHFASKGYRILVSVVQNDSYDFVAEKDGQFLRVNVKTAGIKNRKRPASWSISQASGGSLGHRKQDSCVDVFLVFLPHQSRFVELPGDFLSPGNSKSKLIPRALLVQ